MPTAADAAQVAEMSTPATSSLYSDIMDWAKANPVLASAAVTAGSGLLQGIGNRSNAMELQNLKNQGTLDAQNARLQQIQAGGYTGRLPITVNKGAVLRRPDGTPVYSNGLIGNRLQ